MMRLLHFGEEILDEKGEINRSKLADIVFADEKELENIKRNRSSAEKRKSAEKLPQKSVNAPVCS